MVFREQQATESGGMVYLEEPQLVSDSRTALCPLKSPHIPLQVTGKGVSGKMKAVIGKVMVAMLLLRLAPD